MFLENDKSNFKKKKTVGGGATLPPTTRLRAACVPAYNAAYAEPHRKAVRTFVSSIGVSGRCAPIAPKFGGCHASAISG